MATGSFFPVFFWGFCFFSSASSAKPLKPGGCLRFRVGRLPEADAAAASADGSVFSLSWGRREVS